MKRLLLLIPATLFLAGCATTGTTVSTDSSEEKAMKPSKVETVRQRTVENISRMQRNMRNKGEYYPTGSPDDFYLYFLGQDGKVYRVKRDSWQVIPTEDSFPTVLEQLNRKQQRKLKSAQQDTSKRPRRNSERDK